MVRVGVGCMEFYLQVSTITIEIGRDHLWSRLGLVWR